MVDKLAQIRSIVISAKIEAGENHSPGANAAIAWRTIAAIEKILMPSDADDRVKTHVPFYNDDENKAP